MNLSCYFESFLQRNSSDSQVILSKTSTDDESSSQSCELAASPVSPAPCCFSQNQDKRKLDRESCVLDDTPG